MNHATMKASTFHKGSQVNQPNEQLRQARERTPSPQVPGEPLSRQELAERVNEWVFKHAGKLVELDDNYIGKLERGAIRWPTKLYRDAFRAVLGVEADAQLGFYGRRRKPATLTDVDRQQFLRTAGSAMALPWLGLFTSSPTPMPTKVTPLEIEQVRTATAVFSSWDNIYGGGRRTEAAQRLAYSVAHHGPSYARSRAISRTKLASLHGDR